MSFQRDIEIKYKSINQFNPHIEVEPGSNN